MGHLKFLSSFFYVIPRYLLLLAVENTTTMEFEEVSNYIRRNSSNNNQGPPRNSFEELQQQRSGNPYHALIPHHSHHSHVYRKPTLSNFVSRLKEQSSKTRFIRDIQKFKTVDSNLGGAVNSDSDVLLSEDDGKSLDWAVDMIEKNINDMEYSISSCKRPNKRLFDTWLIISRSKF